MQLTNSDIFCTSLTGNLPTGEAFIPAIREALVNCKIVIFLITEAYMESQFCLAELGAAWALGQTIVPLLVPPLTHEDIARTPLQGCQCLNLFERQTLDQLGTDFQKKKIGSFHLTYFNEYAEEFLTHKNSTQSFSRDKPFVVSPKLRQYLPQLSLRAETENEAQFLLGSIYWEGILVKQDMPKATELLSQAAHDEYIPAQYKLSSMYYKGGTGVQSFKKAFEWEQKAFIGNNPAESFSLGFAYQLGLGCKQDLNKAMECYSQAIQQGYESSYANVAEIYSIWGETQKAVESYEKLVESGYTQAALPLGLIYKDGRKDIPPDHSKAIRYLDIATQAGIMEAKYQLGQLYYIGHAVFERDFKAAFKWFKEAAEEGHIESQYNVGYFYHHGLGVEYSWNDAVYWYERAARRGHQLSQIDVADLYAKADHQEYKKAIYWYEKAALQNSAEAHRKLGDLHFWGIGCEVDQIKAINHYIKAAEQKEYIAQFRLEQKEL